MPVNKEYLRKTLVSIFGSCPLSDEFIDEVDKQSFYELHTLAVCRNYIHDELKIPYSDWYQEIVDEAMKRIINYDNG